MNAKMIQRAIVHCALILLTSIATTSPLSGQRTCCKGDRWIKWSQETRENFVSGFLLGYHQGHSDGCKQAASDSHVRYKGPMKNDPEIKCEDQEMKFSNDFDHLIDSITSLYTRYPEDRDIYPEEILEQLGKGLTVEEIHNHPFMRHKPPQPKP